jgi:hypothetical protein
MATGQFQKGISHFILTASHVVGTIQNIFLSFFFS